MKKSVILAVVGMAAGVVSSYGQGVVVLDNYNSTVANPLITYGLGSGGILNDPIAAGFTVGIYSGDGNFSGAVLPDPSGILEPTSLNASLVFDGNANGTAPSAGVLAFGNPGYFVAAGATQVSPNVGTATMEVVAWLTSAGSYNASSVRGHSAAFTIPTHAGSDPSLVLVGNFMPAFEVRGIPEPSTFALIGLGTGALLFFRRRK